MHTYRLASHMASNPINDYTNMTLILERDAIYTTIGLVAYELYGEYMQFSELLRFMSMEITQSHSQSQHMNTSSSLTLNPNSNYNLNSCNYNYTVIRKRVAWVIYMWSSVLSHSDEVLYKDMYTMLLHLMEAVYIHTYTYIYST